MPKVGERIAQLGESVERSNPAPVGFALAPLPRRRAGSRRETQTRARENVAVEISIGAALLMATCRFILAMSVGDWRGDDVLAATLPTGLSTLFARCVR